MKFFLPLLVSCLLFAACMRPVSYVGSTYPATEDVQVFVDPAAVGRSYTIIGRGYPNRPPGTVLGNTYEKMQREAVEQARKHGAHAVLITDRFYVNQQTNTTISRDTSGRAIGSQTTVGPVLQNNVEILFLRYQ